MGVLALGRAGETLVAVLVGPFFVHQAPLGASRDARLVGRADSAGFRTAIPGVFVHRFWRFSYTPRKAGEHPRLS